MCNDSKQTLLSDDNLTVHFVKAASLNSLELILTCENCYNFYQKLFKPEVFFEETKKRLLQAYLKRSSKESSYDKISLINFLIGQKFNLKGTITIWHCKGHNTMIMYFEFDGFHRNHRRFFSDKFYCR